MGVEFGIIGTDFRLVQECRVDRGWLSKNFTGVRCEMSGRRSERVVVRKLFRVREQGAEGGVSEGDGCRKRKVKLAKATDV